MEDKLKIIERLEEGASHRKVAMEYGISQSSVGYIKKKKGQVRLFVSTLDTRAALTRKSLHGAKDVTALASVVLLSKSKTLMCRAGQNVSKMMIFLIRNIAY